MAGLDVLRDDVSTLDGERQGEEGAASDDVGDPTLQAFNSLRHRFDGHHLQNHQHCHQHCHESFHFCHCDSS